MRRCLLFTRRLIEKRGQKPDSDCGVLNTLTTRCFNFNNEEFLRLSVLSGGVRIAAMAKNCHNDYKMKFSVDDEYPDLSLHNNHMAKVQMPL